MRRLHKAKSMVSMMLVLCMLTGCGSNVYADHKSSYTKVKSVLGAMFDIPSSFLVQTNAITSLESGTELDPARAYLYRDGWETYLLFQMSAICVAGKRGTTFHFDENGEKKEVLDKSSIGNIWFSPDGEFTYEKSKNKGKYKIIIPVVAEVSITNEMYGNFVGYLTVIDYKGTEWSLFIGAAGVSGLDLEKNQKSIISHVVKSFDLTEDADTVLDSVILNGETLNLPGEYGRPVEVFGDTISGAAVEANDEGETRENAYGMHRIGEQGSVTYKSSYNTEETALIDVKRIMTGEEAAAFLREQYNANNIYRNSVEPPEGTHFDVVVYRVSQSNAVLDVDVSMTGTNRNKLRYKGYYYSLRSYEVKAPVIQDEEGMIGDIYRFYIVPDGCEEYALCFGNEKSAEKRKETNAYFYIGNGGTE